MTDRDPAARGQLPFRDPSGPAVRAEAAAAVHSLLGHDLPDGGSVDYERSLEQARREVEQLVTDCSTPLDLVTAGCRCLLAIDEVQRAMDDARRPPHVDHVAELRILSELRSRGESDDIWRATPSEFCAATGFPRAMMSSVDGRRWFPKALHVQPSTDPASRAGARALRSFVTGAVWNLGHAPVEAEVRRTGAPTLIDDPMTNDGTFKPLIRASETRAYVVAAVATRRRTVGFLHADRWGTPVDGSDLDRITAYAEYLGVIVESTEVQRWVRGLPGSAAAALRDTAATMTGPAVSAGSPAPPRARVSLRSAALVEPPGPVDLSALSQRERDVLAELARGLTNAEIARRLGVSPETVKGYVASLLHKLGVPSRAAAVAVLMRGRRSEGGRAGGAARPTHPR
jgi:DNA-binding CsgD family transcriptional regulator